MIYPRQEVSTVNPKNLVLWILVMCLFTKLFRYQLIRFSYKLQKNRFCHNLMAIDYPEATHLFP